MSEEWRVCPFEAEGKQKKWFEVNTTPAVLTGWAWPLFVFCSPAFLAMFLVVCAIEFISKKVADL